MSLALLDLRPPKAFAEAEKKKLVVSCDIGPDGKPFPLSLFGDAIWDLAPYITAENVPDGYKRLRWRIPLADGYLTDPEHGELLEASKDFIWSLFADPVEGEARPLPRTLRVKLKDLTTLLRWMAKQGIRRFADLAGRTMDYVPVARLKVSDGGPAAKLTVYSRLVLVEQIHLQRDKLHDALQTHPWPHETAHSLAGFRRDEGTGKNANPPLPDVLAAEIGEKSLEYVRNRAPGLLGASEAADKADEEARSEPGDSRRAANAKANRIRAARSAIARGTGYEGLENPHAEMIRLRTACYIVIALFSGVRDSELLSIGTRCIAHRRSRDDSTDVIWLHGTAYKGGKRARAWQVSPAVEEAAYVIARLTAPLRARLQAEIADLERRIPLSIAKEKKRLVSRYNKFKLQQDKLFLVTHNNTIGVISGKRMGENLKKFCDDLGIRDHDGRPFPLKSSDFRPTYARFVARSGMGDMLTLREHFGHRDINTTLGYCGNAADDFDTDTELLAMIEVAKKERRGEIVTDLLESDAPLANGGHFLYSWRSAVRAAPDKETLVKEYAGAITLAGTGHSWCVGSVHGTGCGGFCIFEAKMCVDCNYGIIGEEHRPVWEGIRVQQEEALALGDLGLPGIARAEDIRDTAVEVLRRLDGITGDSPIRKTHCGEIGKPERAGS